MASPPLKENYRCAPYLQQFYSGGPFAVSSDGSFIVCKCGESIKIVYISNASVQSTIESDFDEVKALALSPDDKIIFSGHKSHTIKTWDLSTLKCLRSWMGHNVTGMTCHPSGGLLATAGADKIVRVWDIDGSFCTHHFTGHKAVVSSVLFHPDPRKSLISAHPVGDTTVHAWDLLSKACVATLSEHTSGVSSMALSEDGWTLLTSGRDMVVILWDLHDFSCIKTIPTYENLEAVCAIHSGPLLSSCLGLCKQQSGKKSSLPAIGFITVGECGIVRIWNSESAVCLFEQNSLDKGESKRGFTAAIILPSDKGLLCVTADQEFLLYSPVKFPEGTFKFFLSKRLVGNNAEIVDMKFLGDEEQFLAVATNSEQDRTACIWRLPDLVQVAVLKGHKKGIWSVEFSPVDQCVTTASGDQTIKIWAISDGSCLKTFEGHAGTVLRASFLTRGTQFVSSDAKGLLKLWMVKTNECIATYDQHEDKVYALAVGKKTEMLATGSTDAVINLWYDCTASDKEEAFRKEEENVLKNQELENAVLDADFTKAIQVAFELRRPHRLYECLSQVWRKRENEKQLEKALQALGKEELKLLFEYVREWNTKPKYCHVAHFVLYKVFNIFSPRDINEIKGIDELLDGILSYSRRHLSRMERHVTGTFLISYTLAGMSVLEPETDTSVSGKKSFLHSVADDANGTLTDEPEDEEQKQTVVGLKEKAALRKRKSKKSKDGSSKKVKGHA